MKNSKCYAKQHFLAFDKDNIPQLYNDVCIKAIAKQTGKPLEGNHCAWLEPTTVKVLHESGHCYPDQLCHYKLVDLST